MKASKGESTREKMVEVAIGLVAKHGFAETSFQMISDKCELSQSAAMHHFKTKAGLLEAMVGRVVAHNHEIVAKDLVTSDDALTRLQKHARGNLSWALDYHDEGQLLTLLFYNAAFDKKMRALAESTIEGGRKRVEELVMAGQRERLFTFTAPAADIARSLHEALMGSLFMLIAAPPANAKDELKRAEKRMMVLIKGITQSAS